MTFLFIRQHKLWNDAQLMIQLVLCYSLQTQMFTNCDFLSKNITHVLSLKFYLN